MKIRGKIRDLQHPKYGLVQSYHPKTREEAIAENVAKFWPMEPCPIHGDDSVVFVKSGIRACCAHHNAATDWDAAVKAGEPTGPGEASAQGKDYYWTWNVHELCGHSGKSKLNGSCYACAEEREKRKSNSARQIAINAGETWYIPEPGDTCPRGHVAKRRVSNGACHQCEQDALIKNNRAPMIHEMYPNMIIKRADARDLGFSMYRTGEPCGAGHTGWRYVSTGNCLECRKGMRK